MISMEITAIATQIHDHLINDDIVDYNNIAPTYLYELISRGKSYVNSRLGADHHQLIMPPIRRIVQTLFLSVHLFMLLHAN